MKPFAQRRRRTRVGWIKNRGDEPEAWLDASRILRCEILMPKASRELMLDDHASMLIDALGLRIIPRSPGLAARPLVRIATGKFRVPCILRFTIVPENLRLHIPGSRVRRQVPFMDQIRAALARLVSVSRPVGDRPYRLRRERMCRHLARHRAVENLDAVVPPLGRGSLRGILEVLQLPPARADICRIPLRGS